jgi:SNF2 family DNA or RNA helicase
MELQMEAALALTPSLGNEPPLYQHQVADIKFCLDNPLVYNASDCGTGKTRTCIEVIRQSKAKTLVLAPKSILRAAWEDDCSKFAPELKVSVAFASNRDKAFKADADVYVTNIDAVTWLAKNPKVMEKFKGGLLIVDESTAYKHHTSNRSKAAKAISQIFDRRILMSGTPNPNGILDLWGQMLILDEGERLGSSFWGFRQVACMPIQNGPGAQHIKWVDRPGIEDAVFDLISDICIRHRLEDVIDMPKNVVSHMHVDLSHKLESAYLALQEQSLLMVKDKVVTALNAGSLVQKLLQTLSGSVYDENGEAVGIDTERTELVLDLVEARTQSVVAFIWKHQRDQLIAEATKRGITFGVIDGSTPDEKRGEIVNQFQAGELRAIFAHPQSAGHGLTMTRGVATIWASPTYNAEHFKQFNHRIYRAGQKQRTETILISARGTHESKVYDALERKLDSMNTLLTLIGDAND